MVDEISAPRPDVSGASWATTALPVFFTDCRFEDVDAPENIDAKMDKTKVHHQTLLNFLSQLETRRMQQMKLQQRRPKQF